MAGYVPRARSSPSSCPPRGRGRASSSRIRRRGNRAGGRASERTTQGEVGGHRLQVDVSQTPDLADRRGPPAALLKGIPPGRQPGLAPQVTERETGGGGGPATRLIWVLSQSVRAGSPESAGWVAPSVSPKSWRGSTLRASRTKPTTAATDPTTSPRKEGRTTAAAIRHHAVPRTGNPVVSD